MSLVFLLLSLVGLWLGTEILIKGAIRLSQKLGISKFFTGVTILAISTDMPELVVAIKASLKQLQGMDTSGIVIGNIIGSSFNQISLILGLLGFFGSLSLSRKIVIRDGSFLLVSVLLIGLLGLQGEIGRLSGGILLLFYVFYFYFSVRTHQREIVVKKEDDKTGYSIGQIFVGALVIAYMSDLVVHFSLELVENWNVSQSFVGIVLIGLGTSLPELAVSLSAIRKGEKSLSIGNLIGSNIFDLLLVTGVSSLIAPLKFQQSLIFFDLTLLLILTLLALLFLASKRGFGRKSSIVLLSFYLIYSFLKILGY